MPERLGWLDHMVGTVRCENCGATYERDDLEVVARREGEWFVRCDCGVCRMQTITVVTIKRVGRHVSAAGRRPPPVTTDEVLDAHELLERYLGNAEGLFAPRP